MAHPPCPDSAALAMAEAFIPAGPHDSNTIFEDAARQILAAALARLLSQNPDATLRELHDALASASPANAGEVKP